MSNAALASAVKDLSLPEQVVRAVVADYLDFLAERQPKKFAAIDARLQNEPGLHDRFYFEAQGSMLAATLMLTVEGSLDLAPVLREVYGQQADADLLAMRKELVSRALLQAKDSASMTGLSASVLKSRKENFSS